MFWNLAILNYKNMDEKEIMSKFIRYRGMVSIDVVVGRNNYNIRTLH